MACKIAAVSSVMPSPLAPKDLTLMVPPLGYATSVPAAQTVCACACEDGSEKRTTRHEARPSPRQEDISNFPVLPTGLLILMRSIFFDLIFQAQTMRATRS